MKKYWKKMIAGILIMIFALSSAVAAYAATPETTEDYDEVIYFPTGYYTVYSVQYVTKTSEQKNRCCVWKILGYNKNGCVGVATIQR